MNPDALRQLLRKAGSHEREALLRKLETNARQTFKVRQQTPFFILAAMSIYRRFVSSFWYVQSQHCVGIMATTNRSLFQSRSQSPGMVHP